MKPIQKTLFLDQIRTESVKNIIAACRAVDQKKELPRIKRTLSIKEVLKICNEDNANIN